MSRLAGKVAIVTGGAQGIGRGIAEVYAEAGAAVAILDQAAEVGTATASELGLLFVEADVSDEPSVERAVEQVVSELGALHVLVNNAAIFVLKGLEASVEDWQRVMAVNIMGPALVAKHAVRTSAGPAAARSSTSARSRASSRRRGCSPTTRRRRRSPE